MSSVSIAVAFGAGVTSFLAPCTLALVPAFLSYLAGYTLSEADKANAKSLHVATILNTVTFVLGFTLVFVALGSSLGALSRVVGGNTVWLNRVGGGLIIAFGLASLGLLKIPTLERGFTVQANFGRRLRYLGSFLVGATFAVSWVPCVGPILGSIFVLAGTSGSAHQGAILLFAYSLGMMLPFLGAGVFTGWTSALMRRHGRVLMYANYAGGVLLIALGVIVFTNLLPVLTRYLPFNASQG
jgi:cytochrome c-type biogenesis protein